MRSRWTSGGQFPQLDVFVRLHFWYKAVKRGGVLAAFCSPGSDKIYHPCWFQQSPPGRGAGAIRVRSKSTSNTVRARFLTIGQTARIVGVSSSTLRLWESVGLISPARNSGKYRLYNPEMLEVLKRIKYLRDVKRLNVPGIKQELGNGHQPGGKVQLNQQTDLGGKLRKLRKGLGLGVLKAAEQAQISPGFLSAIELSRANPSVATLQRND